MADDPRIDPDDLRGVRFPKSFGRYEARAVDEFLESVARRIEATNRMIDDLQAERGQQPDERPSTSSSAITVLPGPGADVAESDTDDEPPSPFDEAPSTPTEAPDLATLSDDELARLVGDETAHVLSTARSAAADIRAKAEESASRVIREATAEAKRLTDEARSQAEELTGEATTARDTAVAEAEEAAAEIRRSAEEEAARIRADAEGAASEATEAAEQIRAAAEEEAAAAIEEARIEGRSMVAEAKRVRARILTDLQRRRDLGREQVDRLVAGRNRLLDAYAAVRSNVDEITSHLDTALLEAAEPDAESELDDEVASAVAEAEATVGDIRRDDTSGSTAASPTAKTGGDEGKDGEERAGDEAPAAAGPVAEATEATEATEASAARGSDTGDAADPVHEDTVDAPGADDADEPSGADQRRDVEQETGADEDTVVVADDGSLPADDDDDDDDGDVDALFARIRAERAQSVARAQQVLSDPAAPGASSTDGESPPEARDEDGDASGAVAADEPGEPDEPDEPEEGADQLPPEMRAEGPVHEHRAETIETLEKALARSLKRHLADEQNEVLDALRTSESTEFDDLVPAEADHLAGYAGAATEHLVAAAAAGASQVDGGADTDVTADASDVAAVLGESLIAPFRRRLQRSAEDVDGDADALDERLRALYREWKVEHIGPAAGDAIVAAYSAGQLAAAADGAALRWLIEPGSRSCPDCHDNALAGAISKGQVFPTDVDHPPAHPGCRCLLAVDP